MVRGIIYPSKVILAWGEAVSGNKKIKDWLTSNGYPELGLFCYALVNKEDARKWLLENGFPHLLALINGSEGNIQAVQWLQKNGFDILAHMAMAADNDEKAMNWLVTNTPKEIQLLTIKVQFVKNRIDAENEDVHKFSKD